MEIIVKYYKHRRELPDVLEFSHEYEEDWSETDYFCPLCGVKGLWVAAEGDYYAGCQYLCPECGSEACLDSSGKVDNEQNSQRLKAIRGDKRR